MKRCSKCGVEKDLGDFCIDHRHKDGRTSECVKCHQKRGKVYSTSNRGRESHRLNSIKHRELNPIRCKARSIVSNLIRRGKLIKPDICSHCFKKRKVESHHEDYSKPLEVKWLCKKCHTSWEQAKQRFPSFFKNHKLSKEEEEKLLVALKRAIEETVFLMYHDPLLTIPKRGRVNASN